METQVFLIDEMKEQTFDSEQNEQWLKLVQELGLKGQEKLINTENKTLSPVPFPALTEAEREILRTVFNSEAKYTDFSSQTIPLNCLSAIALCEKEKYFHRIEIWSSEQVVDPYIIGVIFEDPAEATKSWSWAARKYYKIAQFGEKLKSLKELLPLYDQFKRQQITDSYNISINNHESQMKKFDFQINAIQTT